MESYTETEPRFAPRLVRERFDTARAEIGSLRGKFAKDRPVRLLAVTKTVPVEVINYAIDELGVDAIGENRVQELLEKYESLHSPAGKKLEIHIIGSLQTNKVKYIADKVDMIESVDSEKLAAEIDKQCKKLGRKMDVLIEVNIGREEQKGGVMPEDVEEFAKKLRDFDSIVLRGLMTIAPVTDSHDEYIKHFGEVHKIFENLKQIYGEDFDTLSMGMSGSFPEAIECGATEIRLGSSLFGKRNYQ